MLGDCLRDNGRTVLARTSPYPAADAALADAEYRFDWRRCLAVDLYIGVYRLTCLRLYALIWMGLVALGLDPSIVQMALNRDTAWLAGRTAGLGVITLYASAFIHFAAIVAAQNLSRPEVDLAYVCNLARMAAAEIVAAEMTDPDLLQIDSDITGFIPDQDDHGPKAVGIGLMQLWDQPYDRAEDYRNGLNESPDCR